MMTWRQLRTERNTEFSKLAKDKLLSAAFFLEHGILTPKSFVFSKENLEKILEEFGEAVIKPTHGMGGKDVLLVEKADATPKDLDLTEFLVQQRVKTKFVDERTFDLRFLIQKEKGKHQNVGSYARVSQPGSFVTNLGQGGRAEDPDQILDLFFADKAASVWEACLELIDLCVKKLEEEVDFLEAGLDVSIDQSGVPYLIEMNSKPGSLGYKILAFSAEPGNYSGKEVSYPEALIQKRQACYERIQKNRLDALSAFIESL